MLGAEILQWDSKHFGFRIAAFDARCVSKNRLPETRRWIAENKPRCIYMLLDPADQKLISNARHLGFNRITSKLVLKCKACLHHDVEATDVCTDKNKVDMTSLLRLAGEAFEKSRFFMDHNFDRLKASAMFEKWVKNAASDDRIAMFYKLNHAQELAGFLTLKPRQESMQIDLIAVNANERGKGLASGLIRSALACSARKELATEVVTQGENEAAVRLYQKHGFEIISQQDWYHAWPEEGTGCQQ